MPRANANRDVASRLDSAEAWQPSAPLPSTFVELPHQIYANDGHWIPEQRDSVRQQFAQSNPWFNDNQAWLGVKEGRARLAGFYNPSLNIDDQNCAFFGYFDCEDDLDACAELFADLEAWARAKGAKKLFGPINFSTFNDYRLRVDNFDKAPFPNEPYNKPWYPRILENLGFSVRHYYSSAFQSDTQAQADEVGGLYHAYEKKFAGTLTFQPLTAQRWLDRLDDFYPLINQMFAESFAFSQIDQSTFRAVLGESTARKLCPKTSVLVTDQDDKVAGFFLCYPDYSPLIRQDADMASSGASPSITAAQLDYQKHFHLLPEDRQMIAKSGGVAPQYRSIKLFSAMCACISITSAPLYQRSVAATVRDNNLSLNFASRHCARSTTRYALFEKALS
jgi:hypothetical protein